MAKKAVATFSGDKSSLRNVVKCIRMTRTGRSGAYAFDEELVQTDKVKDFFAKK